MTQGQGQDHSREKREDLEKGPAQPNPPTGPATNDEDPDQSPFDRSPARRKDRARDEPGRDANTSGAQEIDGAGPNDDTYD